MVLIQSFKDWWLNKYISSQKPSSTREAELQEQEELEMAMAMSLSDQPHPTPSSSSSSQPRKTQSTSPASAPIMQATDDLPMYRDIPSAPSYEPLPEPEYTNPQVSLDGVWVYLCFVTCVNQLHCTLAI